MVSYARYMAGLRFRVAVDEGYDLFDEEDLVQEIDKLRIDHGDTKIWVAKKAKKDTAKKRRKSKRGTVVGSDWLERRLSC
jgi:hypothetical protein